MITSQVLTALALVLVLPEAATGQPAVSGCPTNFPGYHVDKDNEAQPEGCFHTTKGGQVFPAASLQDFTSTVDKKAWGKRGDAKDIIKKCGEEAVKNGAKYFGLQSFGECYYGNTPDLSVQEVTPADGCDTLCKWDVGGQGAIVVYEVVPKTFKPDCQSVHIGYLVDANHWGMFGGCYHSKGATTNTGVFPRAGFVNFKLTIDWTTYINQEHGGDIIKKCGKLAAQKGLKYFGIQYYGDCYFGNTPDLSQGLVTSDCSRKCLWDVGAVDTFVLYEVEDVV
ncbi:hypothetical protein RRG08_056067 [Elysia crispata]|uniref:Uncharacterized protein n=1 Tax=Elysia crispata TaxID=231223 RepID=A0AAE1DEF0_9GAST|nr:hypothetical protein RRG08_056067 [Elysia crispata]